MKTSKHFCLRLTLFLFLIFTIKTNAQLFLPKVDYATGGSTYSVAIGDFNSDNKLDLAVANYTTNTVSILLGNGEETFQNKVDYAVGSLPQSVTVGDFNGDNKSDLAVANAAGNTVSILLGNGDGTFQNKVDYATGSVPCSVAIGDFNRDGASDLAVADWSDNTVSILLGNGDGTFQNKVDYTVGLQPFSVAIGDFNGDGKSDLAVANNPTTTVSILLGNGDGTFQNKVDYTAGTFPISVAIGDFNRDGASDLAVANSRSDNVSILLGNADGTFQNKVDYAAGSAPRSVTIGDFNGDGASDLAVTNDNSDNVSILLGNGDGTFQNKVDYGVGANPRSAAIGDFNMDGKSDLAVANYTTNNVSILINDRLPTAANSSVTINEDNIKTFTASEFNYTDADGDALSKIQITSLPLSGTLFKDSNLNSAVDAGEAILLNGEVTKAEIDANKLKFKPGLNENGTPYTTYNFKVHDGTAYSSSSYTMTVNVNEVAPVLAAIEVAALSYTEGDAAKAITSTIIVSDPDDTNMESAIVRITSNYLNGQDVLSFTNQNGITGTWTSSTGTMALSGSSTKENYQTALRDIKYNNTSDNPSTLARTVSFTVNDGDVNSNTVRRNINIFIPNIPPLAPTTIYIGNLSLSSFTLTWIASLRADGYYLDISTSPSFTSFISDYSNKDLGNVTTFGITGLSDNTTYYIRLRAYNSYGTSTNSNTVTALTPMIPIGTPAATAATSITTTSFNANWNSVSGAIGYCLDVSNDNGFTSCVSSYNDRDVLNVTSYSVTGLTPNTPHYYRVRAYNSGGTSSNSNIISVTLVDIKENADLIPTEFKLNQNYPNPFNPSTKIQFSIPKEVMVRLSIYNTIGQEVSKLVNQELGVGTYSVDFDATELPNGIYFYKIQAGEFTQTKKMILLK